MAGGEDKCIYFGILICYTLLFGLSLVFGTLFTLGDIFNMTNGDCRIVDYVIQQQVVVTRVADENETLPMYTFQEYRAYFNVSVADLQVSVMMRFIIQLCINTNPGSSSRSVAW